MKCLDDCHNYVMDTVLGYGSSFAYLAFYEMRKDGTKIDGVTNEEVLTVLIHRMKYLNNMFLCRENSIVITKLEEALMWLNKRTEDRIARGVEATHNK